MFLCRTFRKIKCYFGYHEFKLNFLERKFSTQKYVLNIGIDICSVCGVGTNDFNLYQTVIDNQDMWHTAESVRLQKEAEQWLNDIEEANNAKTNKV